MINQRHTQHTLLERLKKFSNKRLPNTHNTKLLLVKTGLLIYKCYECELVEWRGKKLSLQLDHIDGNATNNSLSNLRLLCPNCHSQTETYCGKNRKKTNKRFYKKSFCKKCNKELSTTWATQCLDCFNKHKKSETKICWPDKQRLSDLVQNRTSMESLARELGVTSNALRKRCRKYGIDWHQ